MTKREYYDLLVKTSAEGRFPSVSVRGGCAYRGAGGRACAFGLLIPDDRYDPDMEGKNARTLCDYAYANCDGQLADLIPEGMTAEDVQRTQRAHDIRADAWDHEDFVRALREGVFSDVV